MVNKLMATKINTGSAVHLADWGVSVNGITGYSVTCGSGKTGYRNQLHKVAGEFDPNRITCKKCQKAYNEMYAGKTAEELNEMVQADYNQTKAYAESIGTSFKVTEELEVPQEVTIEQMWQDAQTLTMEAYIAKHGKGFYLKK